jgi:hypothetical protein
MEKEKEFELARKLYREALHMSCLAQTENNEYEAVKLSASYMLDAAVKIKKEIVAEGAI